MQTNTIAILMPGDMGHAVGRSLITAGHDVICALDGRSDHSRKLASEGGLRDVGSIADVVAKADLILSILPPAAALELAKQVAEAMKAAGTAPTYVDCNAIAPTTAIKAGEVITGAGANFIDAGIIGMAPGHGAGPRFYVSGPDVTAMTALDGQGFQVIGMGDEIGQGSAIKMAYAGLTKGTWTLHTAVLLAAKRMGVVEPLLTELDGSQSQALGAMRAQVPFIPADSARWVGEMEEIARAFGDAGVTPGFHEGAAEIFRVLARTPFASETRADMDRSRTLEEALAVYADQLAPHPDAAKKDN
jgi:3-hydroxyisobutyrate dehydrogenase-like beta-hydroxyacid dehydrogenase